MAMIDLRFRIPVVNGKGLGNKSLAGFLVDVSWVPTFFQVCGMAGASGHATMGFERVNHQMQKKHIRAIVETHFCLHKEAMLLLNPCSVDEINI